MVPELSNDDIKKLVKDLKAEEKAKSDAYPKTTLSIRIDSDLKELLEVIAAREDRTVSNQALKMLKTAIEKYVSDNGLFVAPERNDGMPTDSELACLLHGAPQDTQ